MLSPLSCDLRERVVHAVQEGSSRRGAARRFGVNPSSAIRWQERYEQEGRVAAKPPGGDRRSRHVEAQDELDPDTLVFLDEAAATTAVARR